MEYRRLFQSVCSGIDPFEVACTAASACNFIYRQLFMPKYSIAILPQNGYTGVELPSFPAALWLCWFEQTARDRIGEKWADEIEIRLYKSRGGLKKGRRREQTLGSLKIDGLLLYKTCDENSSVSSSQMKVPPKIYHSKVLEFFGCYFHGCPSCYPGRSEINKKHSGITMHDLYATTVLDRLNWFTMQITDQNAFKTTDNLKFTVDDVFYTWECEFNRLLELSNIEPQTNRCQRNFMINYLPGI